MSPGWYELAVRVYSSSPWRYVGSIDSPRTTTNIADPPKRIGQNANARPPSKRIVNDEAEGATDAHAAEEPAVSHGLSMWKSSKREPVLVHWYGPASWWAAFL